MDPTDRYLRAWKPVPLYLQFHQQRALSRFFSLLLPLPTAAFSTIITKRKATAEELEAQAESNGYKRERHREKDNTRYNGKHNKKIGAALLLFPFHPEPKRKIVTLEARNASFNLIEFVLDSDDGLSSVMGTETVAAHDLVPEE